MKIVNIPSNVYINGDAKLYLELRKELECIKTTTASCSNNLSVERHLLGRLVDESKTVSLDESLEVVEKIAHTSVQLTAKTKSLIEALNDRKDIIKEIKELEEKVNENKMSSW